MSFVDGSCIPRPKWVIKLALQIVCVPYFTSTMREKERTRARHSPFDGSHRDSASKSFHLPWGISRVSSRLLALGPWTHAIANRKALVRSIHPVDHFVPRASAVPSHSTDCQFYELQSSHSCLAITILHIIFS